MMKKIVCIILLCLCSFSFVMGLSDTPTISLDKSYIVYILDDNDVILNSNEGFLVTNNNNIEMYYLIKTAYVNVSQSNFSLQVGESKDIKIENIIYNEENKVRIVAYTFNKSLNYDFPLYYEYETKKTSNFLSRDVFSFKISIPQDNVFDDVQSKVSYTSHRVHITLIQAFLFIVVLILIMIILPEKKE